LGHHKESLPITGLIYSLRHIGHDHTKNGFFKLVEALPLESYAGRVKPRGLRVPVFPGREPAEIRARVWGGHGIKKLFVRVTEC